MLSCASGHLTAMLTEWIWVLLMLFGYADVSFMDWQNLITYQLFVTWLTDAVHVLPTGAAAEGAGHAGQVGNGLVVPAGPAAHQRANDRIPEPCVTQAEIKPHHNGEDYGNRVRAGFRLRLSDRLLQPRIEDTSTAGY